MFFDFGLTLRERLENYKIDKDVERGDKEFMALYPTGLTPDGRDSEQWMREHSYYKKYFK